MIKPIALIAALLFFFAPAPARADAPSRPGAQSLGIDPGEYSHLASVAAAAPSAEEPLGTVLIAWCEWSADSTVHLGEWSLHHARWLQRGVVRHKQSCPVTLRLAWSKQRLVFVIGTDPGATTELIVMERKERAAGLAFAEVSKVTFENAEAPSLDVDDRFIALATYERVTPIDPVLPNMRTAPADLALHARLLDATTLQIVGARMFRGEHLLRRHNIPHHAGFAIRLLAGRLYVAVADHDPRIVAARLPSLATDFERTFRVPASLRDINSASLVLNRAGENLLIGIESTYVLSPKLETVAKHDRTAITFPLAYDSPTHRILAIGGEPVTLAGWRVRVGASPLGDDGKTVLFAHGRGIVLGDPAGTLRVLP
jgi:hypothetical protein